MSLPESFLKELKAKKLRATRVRVAMLGMLAQHTSLLTAPDIVDRLHAQGLRANKTTVYRELAVLTATGFVREVHFVDGIVRYELTPKDHHHHVVCTQCDTVAHVQLSDNLTTHERSIARKTGFSGLRHALEFYGVCEKCQ